jgi:hypothetical protein
MVKDKCKQMERREIVAYESLAVLNDGVSVMVISLRMSSY